MAPRHQRARRYSLSQFAHLRQASHRQHLRQHLRREKLRARRRELTQNGTVPSAEAAGLTLADVSDDDLDVGQVEVGDYFYLQPLPTKRRRALLRASGVRRIDAEERQELRALRLSPRAVRLPVPPHLRAAHLRLQPGRHPVPGSTSLPSGDHLAGMKPPADVRGGIRARAGVPQPPPVPQVDRTSFPCGCSRDGCGNAAGRIEFNPLRVRTHFLHTLMKLELENRRQEEEEEEEEREGAAAPPGPTWPPPQPPETQDFQEYLAENERAVLHLQTAEELERLKAEEDSGSGSGGEGGGLCVLGEHLDDSWQVKPPPCPGLASTILIQRSSRWNLPSCATPGAAGPGVAGVPAHLALPYPIPELAPCSSQVSSIHPGEINPGQEKFQPGRRQGSGGKSGCGVGLPVLQPWLGLCPRDLLTWTLLEMWDLLTCLGLCPESCVLLTWTLQIVGSAHLDPTDCGICSPGPYRLWDLLTWTLQIVGSAHLLGSVPRILRSAHLDPADCGICSPGPCRLWDLLTWTLQIVGSAHLDPTDCGICSPGPYRLWDLLTWTLQTVGSAHLDPTDCGICSPGPYRLWDLLTWTLQTVGSAHLAPTDCGICSPGPYRLWDLLTWTLQTVGSAHLDPTDCGICSPAWVCAPDPVFCSPGPYRLWDLLTWTLQTVGSAHLDPADCGICSPGPYRLWDLLTWTLQTVGSAYLDPADCGICSPGPSQTLHLLTWPGLCLQDLLTWMLPDPGIAGTPIPPNPFNFPDFLISLWLFQQFSHTEV
ncbi:hypothetical protein DUI87_00418 [Hirundo rustica rustica]|uniref:Cysteine/serine-rich nuclear protein N-terminal domain-containing protein n=1 Tax=Hirundo rustica rustica TaxID=333673 RepID=A0A3M0LHW6_HIRRU|nr:hypothetical protein DUI87_00418 [Hirundo rustica rustica]